MILRVPQQACLIIFFSQLGKMTPLIDIEMRWRDGCPQGHIDACMCQCGGGGNEGGGVSSAKSYSRIA